MERIVDETVDVTEKIHVPIEKKMNLTIKEAAEYSNIGINKIAEMLIISIVPNPLKSKGFCDNIKQLY